MDTPRNAPGPTPSYPPTGAHVTFPESTPDFGRRYPDAGDPATPGGVADDDFEDFVPRWWPESDPDAK